MEHLVFETSVRQTTCSEIIRTVGKKKGTHHREGIQHGAHAHLRRLVDCGEPLSQGTIQQRLRETVAAGPDRL
jgi:hypothetical protein